MRPALAPSAGLDAAACVLDGRQELARLGRWRGLWWRLQILWREQVAGRNAQPTNPWDCGWWRDGPLDPAEVFRPRQATLRARSPSYAKPLRVLLVSAVPMAGMPRL